MNAASDSSGPLPLPGLTWGIKRSFITYIRELPDGAASAADGAAALDSGLFCFAPGDSDYDLASGRGLLRFRGDVRVAGHHGMMFVRLLDPWIELSGSRGILSISTGDVDGKGRVEVAVLRAGLPRSFEGFLVWDHVGVVISQEGSELFDGQYAAGQPMDPLSIRVPA